MDSKNLPTPQPNMSTALLSLRPGADPSAPHPSNGPLPIGKPPAKYTRGLHDKVVELIRAGNTPATAAGYCGLSLPCLNDWLRRGQAGDCHLASFYEDVTAAYAGAEVDLVAVVREQPTKEDAKWILERARSNNWSKATRVAVDSELTIIMGKLKQCLPPDMYRRALAGIMGDSPELNE